MILVRTDHHCLRVGDHSGKPYTHALATIAKVSGEVNMEDFIHDYFSVEKFRKSYEGTLKTMPSQE
jgi:hypothetical protein